MAQFGDLVNRVAELAEDLIGVLVELRRVAADRLRRRVESHRRARLTDAPDVRTIVLDEDLVVDHLRVGVDVADVAQRRGRHVVLVEQQHQFVGAVLGELVFDDLARFGGVLLADVERREALVLQPVLRAERGTQQRELAVRGGQRSNVTIGRRVHLVVGRHVRRLGDALALQGVLHHPVRPQERHGDIEHRDVNVLAAHASLTRQQRGEDPLRRGVRRDLVDDDVAQQCRAARVGISLQLGHPRHRLDDVVVALAADVRTGLAEAVDRDVDQVRVDGPERVLAEAEALGDTRAEVLHEDVDGGKELQCDCLRVRLREIEHQAALAAVDVRPRRADRAASMTEVAEAVATDGLLELDDLGAHVGEEHAGERAGDHLGGVDNGVAMEWAGHGP